jgi:hypothetical protein
MRNRYSLGTPGTVAVPSAERLGREAADRSRAAGSSIATAERPIDPAEGRLDHRHPLGSY